MPRLDFGPRLTFLRKNATENGGLPLYGFYDTFVEFIPFNEEVPIRSSTELNVRRYV